MIGIVDLGLGNIGSVKRMVDHVGGSSKIVTCPDQFGAIDKIILPGVGHFGQGMKSLKNSGLEALLGHAIEFDGIPLIGICLGMQMLCSRSEEGGDSGIGFVDAVVERFQFSREQGLKVPHMGWNMVNHVRENPLILNSVEDQRFYFAHSYRVVSSNSDIIIATTNYGGEFCAAFQQENVFGVQFHPEKSHRFGISLMKRFVEL